VSKETRRLSAGALVGLAVVSVSAGLGIWLILVNDKPKRPRKEELGRF
jgi:hypothetical protein